MAVALPQNLDEVPIHKALISEMIKSINPLVINLQDFTLQTLLQQKPVCSLHF